MRKLKIAVGVVTLPIMPFVLAIMLAQSFNWREMPELLEDLGSHWLSLLPKKWRPK